jgi:hypothetical protein|tara:strand:- start:937 stop:1470 length:534 start_codon:yes stop_codon:yes gene_type:complete
MKDELKKTRLSLMCLAERIEKGDYPRNRMNWGGADVGITSKAPKPTEGGFYPDPRYVVTPFSRELSWLFEEMRDIFSPFLDGCNKIEFYGRLANMANRYQKRLKGKKENKEDLLLAVLHEAFATLEEMDEGNFQFLMVAAGNTIFDDLIERTESEGYLGVDETQKFFKEMEKKHHDA